jgi:hypothetical protein
VGEFGLGQLAKRVIEREFGDSEGSKPVRFSHSDFGLVVQPLDYATGEFSPGVEMVEDEFAASA